MSLTTQILPSDLPHPLFSLYSCLSECDTEKHIMVFIYSLSHYDSSTHLSSAEFSAIKKKHPKQPLSEVSFVPVFLEIV